MRNNLSFPLFYSHLGVIDEVRPPANLPGSVDLGRCRLLQLSGQPGRPGGAQGAAESPGPDSEGWFPLGLFI